MKDDHAMMPDKRLVFRTNGKALDILKLESNSLIIESLGDGEVLVRILAAPINPADLNTIEGTYGVQLPLPATPGIEGFGIVEKSNSGDFTAGDEVIFLQRSATWANYAAVPGEVLYKVPKGIDPLQAAMLKVNPATAWRLLHGFTHLKNGAWIVQNIGNSAIGRCVIQLSRDLGIRTISFVRRPELFDELHALGADHVFIDDDAGAECAQEVLGGANAALAFNAVGGESALRLMKLLCEGGIHITYGAMGRKPLTVPNGPLIFRDLQFRGLWVTRWIENAPKEEVESVYDNLAARVASGKLIQPVDSTYPLEKFQEALARLDVPGRSGKVLFVP